MHHLDWDDLRFFLAVSERGSVSGAAKLLNVNHSTVLRRVASLEKRLGARLFDRLPDGYEMTAQGEELRNQLRGVSEQIVTAQTRLSGRNSGPHGAIRITTTDTLMQGLLMSYLAEFRALHSANPDGNSGRRVGRLRSAIYASKSYLKRNPKKKQWAADDWVAPDEALSHLAQAKWMRENIPEARIAVRVDTLLGMVAAVRSGMGLGMLLCFLADMKKILCV